MKYENSKASLTYFCVPRDISSATNIYFVVACIAWGWACVTELFRKGVEGYLQNLIVYNTQFSKFYIAFRTTKKDKFHLVGCKDCETMHECCPYHLHSTGKQSNKHKNNVNEEEWIYIYIPLFLCLISLSLNDKIWYQSDNKLNSH